MAGAHQPNIRGKMMNFADYFSPGPISRNNYGFWAAGAPSAVDSRGGRKKKKKKKASVFFSRAGGKKTIAATCNRRGP